MDEILKLPEPYNLSKEEILNIIQREEYGIIPDMPDSITVSESTVLYDDFAGSKGICKRVTLTTKNSFGEFSFPLYYIYPSRFDKPFPLFIHMSLSDTISDFKCPTEEILDNGVAIISIFYENITSDDNDFTNGLAELLYKNGQREKTSCGKIGMWSWAMRCVFEYAQTLTEIDKRYISFVGHSRLGKTSLLAGAFEERVFCAFVNNSGCSGAALSRNKKGETIEKICDVFPFWFCENYYKYKNNEDELSFDQHFVIAANYPHRVYVSSASLDSWADPDNEYLSCVAASKYFEQRGKTGFVHPDRLPYENEELQEGYIAYHRRYGSHWINRTDWLNFIKYIKKHTA